MDQIDNFVETIIEYLKEKNGVANRSARAALSRADNPATEYQSWQYLAPFISLTDPRRVAYALISSSIAKEQILEDGNYGIGQAICSCYEDKENEDKENEDKENEDKENEDKEKSKQAQSKLRRLLACTSREEAVLVLRPLLSLIRSKKIELNYTKLLKDLVYFSSELTPAKWAQDFYSTSKEEKK